MTRITPHPHDTYSASNLYSYSNTNNNTTNNFHNHTNNNNNEEIQSKSIHDRNPIIGFCLSFRLFLVTLIMILVIATSFSVWLSAYVMHERESIQSTKILVQTIQEKVINFLDRPLMLARSLSITLADDYHRKVINPDSSLVPYFHSRIIYNNVTMLNICFGELDNNGLFAVDTKSWAFVNFDNLRLTICDLNLTTVVPMYDKVSLTVKTYLVNNTDFYKESLRVFKEYPSSLGGFGTPYKVLSDGVQSIYYAAPVYDRKLWPAEKKRIGISKINLSLGKISTFLSKLKILNRGYIILTEYANDMIIGANLNITGVGFDRIPVRNVTVRSAGSLMDKYLSMNITEGDITKVMGNDGISYMISSSSYSLDNLKWRMIVVCEESEIMENVILSSYVILGVAIGVALIGMLFSILIGYAITKPLRIIQSDFEKIEIMSLEEITRHSSMFTEIRNIYVSLYLTVKWLQEFRAFLPENILNQLETNNATEKPKVITLPSDSNVFENQSKQQNYMLKKENSSFLEEKSSHTSSFFLGVDNNTNNKMNLFKIGLSTCNSSVMYIKITGFNMIDNTTDLSNLLSKCYTNILQLCKTMKVDVHTKSVDEYAVIHSDNITILETSLKIKSFFNSLNETLANEKRSPIDLHIGISTGICLQGNVGNKQMRYFAMIGHSMKCSRDLAYLNSVLCTNILVDESTYIAHKANSRFVFMPVDRYSPEHFSGNANVQTVYEVIRSNNVKDDEWLYELESKKLNDKLSLLCEKFVSMFNSQIPVEEIHYFIDLIEELQTYQPEKIKLWDHLLRLARKKINENVDLSNYCVNIGVVTESMLICSDIRYMNGL